MNLTDKVCVVTGAAAGIGLACARRFLAEGAHVLLSDIQAEKGEEALATLDSQERSAFQLCDVSQGTQVERLMRTAVSRWGRLDVVVANAGIAHPCSPLEMTEQDLDRVLAVNLKGVILTGQTAARLMIEQPLDENGSRGSIINMSSVNAVMAIPGIPSYCVAKGGVNQWTKCLALELADKGVRVNGIGPGSIRTEMFQSVANDPTKLDRVLSRTPMGRPGEPDEIARVAVFLAGPYSSYMTGQTLYPDGGRLGLNYTVPVVKPDT